MEDLTDGLRPSDKPTFAELKLEMNPWRRPEPGEPCPACGETKPGHFPGSFLCAKRLYEQNARLRAALEKLLASLDRPGIIGASEDAVADAEAALKETGGASDGGE